MGGVYGRGVDFYVDPNSMVLPGKYKNWIGVSKRDKLLKRAKNEKLKNAIKQLYRPGSFIGDGGTASVLKFEKRTGERVSASRLGHYNKAIETVTYLKRIISNEHLSKSERKLATNMVKKLNRSIWEWEDRV